MKQMHANSLAAYHESGDELSERESAVMGAVRQLGAATDRQIKAHLGFTDMNAVRPRVTELLKRGVLVEAGDTQDTVTGKTVRLVRIALREPEQLNLGINAA